MAAILNSAMLDSNTAILDSDTLLSSLRFTQKHSHSTLMLTQTNSIWLKLIQFWLNLKMAAILEIHFLEFGHLGFSHHSIYTENHWHLSRLIPTICTKKLHSFILTQPDDGSHLEFCHLGLRHCHLWFRHLVILSQIHSKTLLLHLMTLIQSWIQSDSSSFILIPTLDDGSHLGIWQIPWIQPSWSFSLKLTPKPAQDWFPPSAQKNFTHSFWLNLMMAAILNSAMLDSAMAIMDSDTLLSSLRFPQKHSHSTLALTQTNSIWLTWWWQPSWILSSWIQQFHTKELHSFILTQLDDGSHLEFSHGGMRHCHLGFRHLVIFSPDSLKNTLTPLWLLTQTNSIWLKLNHSHLTWWWQPSWIQPCWIETLPSWIQTPLLSSLGFTQKHYHSRSGSHHLTTN